MAGFRLGNVVDDVLYFRLGENCTETLKRRWGIKYAFNEFLLYRKFFRLGFYDVIDFGIVLICKIPLRLVPFKLFKYLYLNFFR